MTNCMVMLGSLEEYKPHHRA